MQNPVCQVIDAPEGRIITNPEPCPAYLSGADLATLKEASYWPARLVGYDYDRETHDLVDIASKVVDEDAGVVVVTYRTRTKAETAALVAAAEQERAKREAIDRAIDKTNARRDALLAAGAPYAGRRIDVSDRGRADIGGMVSAAILASSGAAPWSEGYARGWIAMDNTRIPLPTPADGIQLAASVGDWYGRLMQHARDLKDDILTAPDPAAIDITAGWPE